MDNTAQPIQAKDGQPLTWADLKTFVNQLNEKQLQTKLVWLGEERGGYVSSLKCFEEDYINPSGDGVEPVSAYKNEPEVIEDEEVIYEQGEPAIWVD